MNGKCKVQFPEQKLTNIVVCGVVSCLERRYFREQEKGVQLLRPVRPEQPLWAEQLQPEQHPGQEDCRSGHLQRAPDGTDAQAGVERISAGKPVCRHDAFPLHAKEVHQEKDCGSHD